MTAFEAAPVDLATVSSPDWLSHMLGLRWPGTVVRRIEVVELLATQATKVRLKMDVEGGGADVPTAICIKGVLTDTGALPSASVVETLFYREAAAHLPVRVPDCIYAGMQADNSRGVIVMRDVIAAGSTFCTALDPFNPIPGSTQVFPGDFGDGGAAGAPVSVVVMLDGQELAGAITKVQTNNSLSGKQIAVNRRSGSFAI